MRLSKNTIRTTIFRWVIKGTEGLWDSPKSERKITWNKEDIKDLKDILEKYEITANS